LILSFQFSIRNAEAGGRVLLMPARLPSCFSCQICYFSRVVFLIVTSTTTTHKRTSTQAHSTQAHTAHKYTSTQAHSTQAHKHNKLSNNNTSTSIFTSKGQSSMMAVIVMPPDNAEPEVFNMFLLTRKMVLRRRVELT